MNNTHTGIYAPKDNDDEIKRECSVITIPSTNQNLWRQAIKEQIEKWIE